MMTVLQKIRRECLLMPEQNKETYQQMSFDKIRIGLASPEKIREWSRGEVTKPDTINYRHLNQK